MFITREADYAVRCILFLSVETDRIVSASEISKSMFIPRSFLAKILQRLSNRGIVTSTKGTTGGFQLARAPVEVNLLEVIEAIQGPSAANTCAIDERSCKMSDTCAIHPVWVQLRQDIENTLREENFAKLVGKQRPSGSRRDLE
jgi:Rrf2 family protein